MLVQAHILSVEGTSHSHTVESVSLSEGLLLDLADALHGHTAESVVLTQGGLLAVASALHLHASGTFRSVIGIRAAVRQISMDLAESVSLRYVAGNSIDLEFTATRDGEPAPIGGVIARFVLSKNGTPAVSTEDSDHSAVATLTDAGSGIFTVTVAAQYTQALLGTYQFQAELEDALGGIATVSRGFITFDRNLLLVA